MKTRPKPKKIYPQTRKSVSMSGVLFQELKAYCKSEKKPMSEVVEAQMRIFLKMPAREAAPIKKETPAPAPRLLVEEKPKARPAPSKKSTPAPTHVWRADQPVFKTKPATVEPPKKMRPEVVVIPPPAAPSNKVRLKSDPPSLPITGPKSSNIVMF